MNSLRRVILLSLIVCSVVSAAQKASSETNFVSEKNVAVPMRDGVILRADVLHPKAAGPFPVVVYRTPYGKEHALKDYTTFVHAVERGHSQPASEAKRW